jgi:pimeloyl-ACP methyl ester carboxylesterase
MRTAVTPRRFVHVAGVRTAYLDIGAGEPIVALHGIPTSSELFDPLLPGLEGFRLLAPDLLGQGRTELPPRGPIGHAQYAAHLAAFLDTVAPPTFHLVVHDFGGVLGLPWAAAHPERLRTVVVLSTIASPTMRWAIISRARRAIQLLGGATAVASALPGTAKRIGAIGAGLAARWGRPWTRRRLLRGSDHWEGEHLRRAEEALRGIPVPTLVLWGKDDEVFPVRYGRRIRKRIPRAELKVVPQAGHFLPVDAPDTTAAEIAAFARNAGTSAASGERLVERFRPPTAS